MTKDENHPYPDTSPRCLFCPEKPFLIRKGYYNTYEENPLYALVPLKVPIDPRQIREQHETAWLTPVRVFVCGKCGFLALFSEDVELEWKAEAESIAHRLDYDLRHPDQSPRQ